MIRVYRAPTKQMRMRLHEAITASVRAHFDGLAPTIVEQIAEIMANAALEVVTDNYWSEYVAFETDNYFGVYYYGDMLDRPCWMVVHCHGEPKLRELLRAQRELKRLGIIGGRADGDTRHRPRNTQRTG